MKVLLIQSYVTVPKDNPNLYFQEPIGLVSLATYIENKLGNSAEVKVLDLYELGNGSLNEKNNNFILGLNDEKIICERIANFNPAIIGTSANFTAYFQDVSNLAKLISVNFPGIKLVLGGAHATMDAENIMRKYSFIDYIVRGEGEVTFLELLQAHINGHRNFSQIKGLTYRDKDNIESTEDRPLVKDLNVFPMPNRKFINMNFYREINCKTLGLARNSKVAIVITSRGCPFNCIFCSTKNMWRRQFRAFSAERVAEEIKYLYDTYGIREIAFWDDQFFTDRKRAEDIFDYIIQLNLRKLSFSMPSGTSGWLVDENLLKKMKKAGFYRLCFPIESANENTAKFVGKPINLVKIKEIIKLACKLGFWTSGNFMIGFPYETRSEIETTIKYAYECGVDYPVFMIAKPQKGAELYDIFIKEGLLKKVIEGTHTARSDYGSKNLSAYEIDKLYQKAVKGILKNKIKFYAKPTNFHSYFLPKFQTYDDIKYFFKLLYIFLPHPLKLK